MAHIEVCAFLSVLENERAMHPWFTVPVSGNLRFRSLQRAKDRIEDPVAFAAGGQIH